MSKLVVCIAIPAALAAAALVVVNLQLADRVDELQARVHDLETGPAPVAPQAGTPIARPSRRDDSRVRALEDRIATLESRPMAAPAVAELHGDREASPATLVVGGTDVERAVISVLDAREAAKRHDRREKMAARSTERLLRDVDVTDAQRAQVSGLVADHLRRMGEMRGQELGPEFAGERAQELRDELRRGLEGVLDASQMETVGSRIERRFGEGTGRSADRRGGRRPGRARKERTPTDG